MSIDIWSVSPLALLGLVGLAYRLRRGGRSYGYLLCIAAFYLYLMVVARWTVFPLRFDAEFVAIMRQETTLLDGINIIPFRYAGGLAPLSEQVYGNFLMGMPFGFGFPFIVQRGWRFVIAAAVLFSAAIEMLQLVMDLVYGFAYRAVDVNDFILVGLGGTAGYAAFRLVAELYRRLLGDERGDQGIWTHAHMVLTR
jgi:glycopeptide antibiotics resistance protein